MADVAIAKLPVSSDHPVASSVPVAAASDPITTNDTEIESPDSNAGPDSTKSNNSHHHESEYDTASDLEDGEDDYDDDDESLGHSGDEDDRSESSGDDEAPRADVPEQGELPKKVDEDRSNPQYIPKKGTFYEHDDRTADEPGLPDCQEEEAGELEGGDGVGKSATPNISNASKTMKKWQPASGVDRWSHDRYDEGEQAPKSRSELVSAYGYDIRNEDGPPRARRRRHYARGPTKYDRKWEDEDAYIKVANNTSRKPPRPDEFPALGDKKGPQKSRSFREEKENRYERNNERNSGNLQRGGGGGGSGSFRDRDNNRRSSGKAFRSGGRLSGMEFKNKNRPGEGNRGQPSNRPHNDREQFPRHNSNANEDNKAQVESVSFTNTKVAPHPGTNQTGTYNGNEGSHHKHHAQQQPQHQQMNQSAGGYREKMNSGNNAVPNRQVAPQVPQNSHLSTRLQQVQQVQNRNDPSHVGSVQMNSLVAPNQQPSANSIQNALEIQQNMVQEQNRVKRYSSLRQRSQNDPSGQLDSHSMQQIQMQHDPQHVAVHQQPQQMLLQDQHLLQANLLQLYHQQENIQAQMAQAIQVAVPPQASVKPQYPNVQPQYQAAAPNPQAAYYAAANEYAAPPQQSAAQPQAQYNPPQQPAYMQQAPLTAQIAYNPVPNAAMNQPTAAAQASAATFVQTPAQNPATAAGPYTNYSSYQNYNTVGGTTYFASQPQPVQRPAVLPQRRPTNAIPILPPSDKNKRNQDKDDDKNSNSSNSMTTSASSSTAPIGSAENIDHILDNMFVQRPPYEPPTRKSASPPTEDVSTTPVATIETATSTESNFATAAGLAETIIDDAVKNLSIADEPKPSSAVPEPRQEENVSSQPQTSTPVDSPATET